MDGAFIQSVDASAENITSDKTERREDRLAIFLALIAGYTDAYGFMRFKTYVSFMSGNTTQVGFSLSLHHLDIVFTSAIAICGFVTGIFAGSLFSFYKWYRPRAMPFLITALLLAFNLLLSFYYKTDAIINIGLISLAMGFMNTIINHIGSMSINTDFVTGTLSSMAKHLAQYIHEHDSNTRRKHIVAAARLLFIWIGFLFGAWVSVIIMSYMGLWSLCLPILFLMAAPFFVARNTLQQ